MTAVEYGDRSSTITVQLASGKNVKVSLTSSSKEAWNQVLATPVRQQAERALVMQGKTQQERDAQCKIQAPKGHIHSRHGSSQSPLKIQERSSTGPGEVFKVKLQGEQTVWCSMTDTSPETVRAILSPKMQMERKQTEFKQTRSEASQQQQHTQKPQQTQSKTNKPKR